VPLLPPFCRIRSHYLGEGLSACQQELISVSSKSAGYFSSDRSCGWRSPCSSVCALCRHKPLERFDLCRGKWKTTTEGRRMRKTWRSASTFPADQHTPGLYEFPFSMVSPYEHPAICWYIIDTVVVIINHILQSSRPKPLQSHMRLNAATLYDANACACAF